MAFLLTTIQKKFSAACKSSRTFQTAETFASLRTLKRRSRARLPKRWRKTATGQLVYYWKGWWWWWYILLF